MSLLPAIRVFQRSDILLKIIRYATAAPSILDTSYTSTQNEDPHAMRKCMMESLTTKRALSLISHHFHAVTDHVLYEFLVVRSRRDRYLNIHSIPAFKRQLAGRREPATVGHLVRGIDVECETNNIWLRGMWDVIRACPNLACLRYTGTYRPSTDARVERDLLLPTEFFVNLANMESTPTKLRRLELLGRLTCRPSDIKRFILHAPLLEILRVSKASSADAIGSRWKGKLPPSSFLAAASGTHFPQYTFPPPVKSSCLITLAAPYLVVNQLVGHFPSLLSLKVTMTPSSPKFSTDIASLLGLPPLRSFLSEIEYELPTDPSLPAFHGVSPKSLNPLLSPKPQLLKYLTLHASSAKLGDFFSDLDNITTVLSRRPLLFPSLQAVQVQGFTGVVELYIDYHQIFMSHGVRLIFCGARSVVLDSSNLHHRHDMDVDKIMIHSDMDPWMGTGFSEPPPDVSTLNAVSMSSPLIDPFPQYLSGEEDKPLFSDTSMSFLAPLDDVANMQWDEPSNNEFENLFRLNR
ncbi:hypothetical protein HETIRDRAFT_117239 [Heterobasidion irregulare TC 32-1]|uniref:Uncharacterized protein n=1 Tax=Heterobasidion irregulare (strain TC 32-1) TaxID=747525 RepID=W4K1M7_HETIT|nr:uncharacterized protein HETIRDRAFT_117239 [Heterobasidion irregulare TC 32-1]ETW79624.1 hypothetical protein HETIRDRAFT_117239 [Heterobasidion irregulare TC 32-1]